jgi:tetratricopeptide (TPR) repeat protein
MQNLLDEALRLRSEGRLEEARNLLVRLAEAYPDHPEIRAHATFVHDALGLESEAIPHYEAALRLGLAGPLLADVFLGLGSTWRCLDEYEKARSILEQGVERFPEDRALQVFLAMTLHTWANWPAPWRFCSSNWAKLQMIPAFPNSEKPSCFIAIN